MKDINLKDEKKGNGTKMGMIYPYRGKSVSSGDWVFGFFMEWGHWDNPYIIVQKGPISLYGTDFIFERVLQTTIGRFIGIRDKNGQALYSGDIVKGVDVLTTTTFKGVIKFKDASFYIDELNGITHYRWQDYEVECIGNIHDNPELVEAEE